MLAAQRLPFAVPSPMGAVSLNDGRTMRVERLLPGRPLDEFYEPAQDDLEQRVIDAVIYVLGGLREFTVEGPTRTILDGEAYLHGAASKSLAPSLRNETPQCGAPRTTC